MDLQMNRRLRWFERRPWTFGLLLAAVGFLLALLPWASLNPWWAALLFGMGGVTSMTARVVRHRREHGS
jgi:hypothetical protein